MHRRKFVAATALAAAAQADTGPVRATPLKASYWGTQFYDEKEKAELLDVLEARSPFRWYGPPGAEEGPAVRKRVRRPHGF